MISVRGCKRWKLLLNLCWISLFSNYTVLFFVNVSMYSSLLLEFNSFVCCLTLFLALQLWGLNLPKVLSKLIFRDLQKKHFAKISCLISSINIANNRYLLGEVYLNAKSFYFCLVSESWYSELPKSTFDSIHPEIQTRNSSKACTFVSSGWVGSDISTWRRLFL